MRLKKKLGSTAIHRPSDDVGWIFYTNFYQNDFAILGWAITRNLLKNYPSRTCLLYTYMLTTLW
jgi:hypothetical protein